MNQIEHSEGCAKQEECPRCSETHAVAKEILHELSSRGFDVARGFEVMGMASWALLNMVDHAEAKQEFYDALCKYVGQAVEQ